MNSGNKTLFAMGALLLGLIILVQACKPRAPVSPPAQNTPTPSEASLARNKVIISEVDSNGAFAAANTHVVLKNIGSASISVEDWWLVYRNNASLVNSIRLDSDNNNGATIVFNWGDDTLLTPGETLTIHLTETNGTPLVGQGVYVQGGAAVSDLAPTFKGGQVGVYTETAVSPFMDSRTLVDYMTYGYCFSPGGYSDYQGVGLAAGQWNTNIAGCKSPTPTPTATLVMPLTSTQTHTPAAPSHTITRTPTPSPTLTPCAPENPGCDYINIITFPAGSTIQNPIVNPVLLQNNSLDWIVAPYTAQIF